MKKKYIEPSVLCKNVILDDLVCLSIIGGEGGSEPEAVPGGGTGDDESDGLVKGENLWDEEW